MHASSKIKKESKIQTGLGHLFAANRGLNILFLLVSFFVFVRLLKISGDFKKKKKKKQESSVSGVEQTFEIQFG